jgi:hypothetical protein
MTILDIFHDLKTPIKPYFKLLFMYVILVMNYNTYSKKGCFWG